MLTEIAKVRASLFQISGVKKEPLTLPEPEGEIITLTEKVYVPVKEHPDVSIYNLFIMNNNFRTLPKVIIKMKNFKSTIH